MVLGLFRLCVLAVLEKVVRQAMAAFAQKINCPWCANAAIAIYRLKVLANERNEALAKWSEVEPTLSDPRRGK